MNRSIIAGVSGMLLATAPALAQPAPAGHQVGEESAVVATVDVFDLVKIEGEWRVSNAMWTVEPEACKELRPADASQLRPHG